MEKSKVRGAEELALEELEAQHVELLPDRIELRRRVRNEATIVQVASQSITQEASVSQSG